MTHSDIAGKTVAEGVVHADWIDYNGHMNVAYYVLAFDLAVDALWARLGITEDSIRRTQGSTFAAETHVTYQRELREAEPYIVTLELIAYDEKRVHHFQRMYHAEDRYLAATAEWMSLHVDLKRRKVSAWPDSVLRELAVMASEQGDAAMPREVCAKMRVPNPHYSIEFQGA